MIILGVTGPKHDTAAALLVDGQVVAAAEEERFTRTKHGIKQAPEHAVRFVLEHAGLAPDQVDAVAYPWSGYVWRANRGRQLRRSILRDPRRAIGAYMRADKRFQRLRGMVRGALDRVGVPWADRPWTDVPHHHAHAASAYLFAGFGDCAVLTCDGLGEYVATQWGSYEDGDFEALGQEHMPHSLGCFYSTMTEFLGWRFNDGEYKLMGMAPYGDADKVDLSSVGWVDNAGRFRVDPRAIWVPRGQRWQNKPFSHRLVDLLGTPREGDALREPYTHIAAATQRVLERAVVALIEGPLRPILERTGKLAFAGGCALNVALNRHLLNHPLINELFVPPPANDSGTCLGAAAFAADAAGDTIVPFANAYLGPSFDDAAITTACAAHDVVVERPENIVEAVADLLAAGTPVAWFQGRMEYGPRALGNRSILAHPAHPGISDLVNEQIKFRETWRPFCPAILDTYAEEILGSNHAAPYMTIAFEVNPTWRERIGEVVHVDHTARPQVVDPQRNARFHELLTAFHARTQLPVLMNTSLNRRGEPMACTPADALAVLLGSELPVLAMGDVLVRKPG